MELKFFLCEHCGSIAAMVRDSGVPVVCCGQEMTGLVPNTSDGAHGKHVPIVSREGAKVAVHVGGAAYPMRESHCIEWIVLQTGSGSRRKALRPGGAPEAAFCVSEDDEVVSAYAFCNLRGLRRA